MLSSRCTRASGCIYNKNQRSGRKHSVQPLVGQRRNCLRIYDHIASDLGICGCYFHSQQVSSAGVLEWRGQSIVTRAGSSESRVGQGRIRRGMQKALHRILVNNSRLKHGLHMDRKKRKSERRVEYQDATSAGNPDESSVIARDPHLKQILELSSDEDLKEMYDCLHGVSVFSPVAKSILFRDFHKEDIETAGREDIELYIESRFRFLAADARHLLHSIHYTGGSEKATVVHRWPSYRDTLLDIRKQLQVPCPSNLDTVDLEVEIFLHLLSEHGDYVQHSNTHASSIVTNFSPSSNGPQSRDHKTHEKYASKTDPVSRGNNQSRNLKPGVFRSFQGLIVSPLSFGLKGEMLPTLAKTIATVALTKTQIKIIQNLGSIVLKRAAHLKAMTFIYSGSTELAKRVAIENSKQRLLGAATLYTSYRQLFTCIGPILWISSAWDLTKMSVGTDYARLTRTVFLMAQIRLLKTRGWH